MTEFTFWGELKGEVQKQFSMSLGKAVNKTRRNSNDSSMVLCIMGQSLMQSHQSDTAVIERQQT